MRLYILLLKVGAFLFLPATISGKWIITSLSWSTAHCWPLTIRQSFKGNLDETTQLPLRNDGRELKKGHFLCEISSSTAFCFKATQLCDTSTGKARCICPEGWHGSRCQNRIDELPLIFPTRMPTFSRVGGNCSETSDCPATNSDCLEGQCQCESGFIPRKGNCINVNECEEGFSNGCDRNSECLDTIGNYDCRCKDGFSDTDPNLPGRLCQQINECKLATHNCDEATQVCLDRRPPIKWECVERTPAPTPKPTNKPITPSPTTPPRSANCNSGLVQMGNDECECAYTSTQSYLLCRSNAPTYYYVLKRNICSTGAVTGTCGD